MSDVSEGEKLRKLLEAKRYEQTELAEAVGVTKAAVGKWLRLKRFSPKVWDKICVGLEALHLSPGDIRPQEGDGKEYGEDLTKLVENWPRVQLSVLKRILESGDTSRAVLLAYINGSLREFP